MSYYKRQNFIKKFHKKNAPKLSSRRFFCLQRIKHNHCCKMKLVKQGTYIRHVLAKLSKFVQISTLTSSDSFLQRILGKLTKLELVSRPYFLQNILIILLQHYTKWPNFITRLCLLPKLFSKMFFVFLMTS